MPGQHGQPTQTSLGQGCTPVWSNLPPALFQHVGRRHVIHLLPCDNEPLSTGSQPTKVPRENCLNWTFSALNEKTDKTMACFQRRAIAP